mgnify:CR=1 FL=1
MWVLMIFRADPLEIWSQNSALETQSNVLKLNLDGVRTKNHQKPNKIGFSGRINLKINTYVRITLTNILVHFCV